VKIAGVLLTGGRSRRMGTDKATLVVGGETLGARSARLLSAVCDPVVEVGGGTTGLPSVREESRGEGPLVAFLAGVDAIGPADGFVLLACDLPNLDEATLRLVADHPSSGSVVPTVAGARQYGCSRWSPAAVVAARDACATGERAMKALLTAGDAALVAADDRAAMLADADSPDDLRRLGLS